MSTYPHPVIFLPGIMGSSLRDEYPVAPETVWSAVKMMLNAYDRITLHPDDTRYEVQGPARVVRDQPFGLIYAEFVEELRHNLSPQPDEPVPVFPFAFDWRRPLVEVEQDLAAFVDEVIARTKLLRHYHAAGFGSAAFPAQVNLIGHSMGGMIIAGYLQSNGFAKVNKVVTIASPFRGSLEAVAKTATGMGALGASPGSSRERESARVTPSLYHLLPSFEGAVTPASLSLFTVAAWQPAILQSIASFFRMYGLDQQTAPEQQATTLLAKLLTMAADHRRRLEQLTLADPKKWLSIVGLGRTTRVGMGISLEGGAPSFDLSDTYNAGDWSDAAAPHTTQTGDGTVPYLGARASFIPTAQVVCVTADDFSFWEVEDRVLLTIGLHSDLPNMNLVQRLATCHLKGAIYGDVWGRRPPDLPAGATWDPPIAGLTERT